MPRSHVVVAGREYRSPEQMRQREDEILRSMRQLSETSPAYRKLGEEWHELVSDRLDWQARIPGQRARA
jgi:hypothetical protein